MKIETEIKKVKKYLINIAKKHGLYENFGQIEVKELKAEFGYDPYGDGRERKIVAEIDNFNNWCMNFDDKQLETEI